MKKHMFEKPVSEEALVVAWHTVGFDYYIEKLGKMYDISKDQFYTACKDNQEVRDEIIGNFYKGLKDGSES